MTRRSGGVGCRPFDSLDPVLQSDTCDELGQSKFGSFRGSMAGLCAPLSTLRRGPLGPLRMTRGWFATPSS